MAESRFGPPPPWWLAAMLGCALVGAIDGALSRGGADPAGAGAGLAATLGLLAGLALDGLGALTRRMPAWAALLLPCALGLLAGSWLVDELGAWERLDGPYRTLALVGIAGGLGGGAAVGLAAWAQLPNRRWPEAWALSGLRRRFALVALLAVAAALTTYIDRTRLVGLYPAAHEALQGAALLAIAGVLHAVIPYGRVPRGVRRALLPLGLLVGAGTFAALDDAPRTLSVLSRRPFTRLALDTLRDLTDVDRDGVSALLGGGDLDAFDPDVTDFADDDAQADPTLAAGERGAAERAPQTSVVLITIDTLRPDRMSVYGHRRDTTPRIKRWARDAVRFDRAYTTGAWTSLAVSSLMRGVFPRRLRWTRLAETTRFRLLRKAEMTNLAEGERLKLMFGLPLEDPRPTLAERLAERGLHTMAVVDDGYSSFLSEEMRTSVGFAEFSSTDRLDKDRRNDRGTTDLALEALERRPKDQPFFLWVHYFGPHAPSHDHGGPPRWGTDVAAHYDHVIRYTDTHVGRLLAEVERIADDEPVAVLLTSDHGEDIGPRHRVHGSELTEDQIRVPMLLSAPGLRPGTSDAVVSLVDVAPTLLAITGTPVEHSLDGLDLRTLLAEPPDAPAPRVLMAETWRFNRHGKPVQDLVAVYDGAHKLVLDRVRNLRTLYRQGDDEELPDGEPSAEHLTEALNRYLAQTRGGRVDLHD